MLSAAAPDWQPCTPRLGVRACSPSPLDNATEARLASAAARLGEAPDARAVGTYLEDLEDYARAAEAWAELDPAGVRSLDAMKAELGLAG